MEGAAAALVVASSAPAPQAAGAAGKPPGKPPGAAAKGKGKKADLPDILRGACHKCSASFTDAARAAKCPTCGCRYHNFDCAGRYKLTQCPISPALCPRCAKACWCSDGPVTCHTGVQRRKRHTNAATTGRGAGAKAGGRGGGKAAAARRGKAPPVANSAPAAAAAAAATAAAAAAAKLGMGVTAGRVSKAASQARSGARKRKPGPKVAAAEAAAAAAAAAALTNVPHLAAPVAVVPTKGVGMPEAPQADPMMAPLLNRKRRGSFNAPIPTAPPPPSAAAPTPTLSGLMPPSLGLGALGGGEEMASAHPGVFASMQGPRAAAASAGDTLQASIQSTIASVASKAAQNAVMQVLMQLAKTDPNRTIADLLHSGELSNLSAGAALNASNNLTLANGDVVGMTVSTPTGLTPGNFSSAASLAALGGGGGTAAGGNGTAAAAQLMTSSAGAGAGLALLGAAADANGGSKAGVAASLAAAMAGAGSAPMPPASLAPLGLAGLNPLLAAGSYQGFMPHVGMVPGSAGMPLGINGIQPATGAAATAAMVGGIHLSTDPGALDLVPASNGVMGGAEDVFKDEPGGARRNSLSSQLPQSFLQMLEKRRGSTVSTGTMNLAALAAGGDAAKVDGKAAAPRS